MQQVSLLTGRLTIATERLPVFGQGLHHSWHFHSLILSYYVIAHSVELLFPGYLGSIFTDLQPDLGCCSLFPNLAHLSALFFSTDYLCGWSFKQRIGLCILLL